MPEPARPEPQGGGPPGPAAAHEIERAVIRLNEWFGAHEDRIPRCWDGHGWRRKRFVPRFEAVPTTSLHGWKPRDLARLFRVAPGGTCTDSHQVEVSIELLVADKSAQGCFLDVPSLMRAALELMGGPSLLGRRNPRLWWFWLHLGPFVQEIESYVNGIRLRLDAATAIPHDQARVFEEFRVPLQNGQQTALGKNCFFTLEHVQPLGARAYWAFRILRDGEVVVGPQVLQMKPIYLGEELLAVVKRVDPETVTLNVLTSSGIPGQA
jgi:hypothetical protein